MAIVKGKWRWSNSFGHMDDSVLNISEFVAFISGGSYDDGADAYEQIAIIKIPTGYGGFQLTVLYCGSGKPSATVISHTLSFGAYSTSVNENLRVMDFGETDQEVSEEFYNFLVANATPVLTIAEQLTQIAENVQKIFDAGYAEGTAQGGYNEGYNEGKQAEWDALWEGIQLGGTRGEYARFFMGEYWNADTFKPKYDINASASGAMIFDKFNGLAYSGMPAEGAVDLSELLNKAGVVLDTSKCTNLTNTFYSATISKVPFIDATGITSALSGTFSGCRRLHTIEGLKVKASDTYKGTFDNLTDLQNLTMYGTIGQNGFDTHWSTKLSRASIESIVNALSTETSDLTITFSKEAVFAVYNANDDDWGEFLNEVVMPHGNWNFSLV